MRVEKEVTPEEYARKSLKLKTEQRELEIQKNSLITPEESTAAAVKFGLNLVREFPLCWQMLEPGELKVLRNLFFPKNVEYCYPKFKTAELAIIFNVKSDSTDQNDDLVTLTIQNSKPIVEFLKELSSTASKFTSFQNKGFLLTQHAQEVTP